MRFIIAVFAAVLLSVPAMAQSQNTDVWSSWITTMEKSLRAKTTGIEKLKGERDSACSREDLQIDKDACQDFYNGIVKRAESEKVQMQKMVTKAKKLPVNERGQILAENAEYNRKNALTDDLYRAVVAVYPPLKQAPTSGAKP